MQKILTKANIFLGILLIMAGIYVGSLIGKKNTTTIIPNQTQSNQVGGLTANLLTNLNIDTVIASSKDTDNDNLPDEVEAIFGSDPNINDTDGDGYLDGEEVINGYLPTVPHPNDHILKMPSDAEIKIADSYDLTSIKNYLEKTKTPPLLQSGTTYQEAIASAKVGDKTKILAIISALNENEKELKLIEVPKPLVNLHKLTLSLFAPIKALVSSVKLVDTDPAQLLKTTQAMQPAIPFINYLQAQINTLKQQTANSTTN